MTTTLTLTDAQIETLRIALETAAYARRVALSDRIEFDGDEARVARVAASLQAVLDLQRVVAAATAPKRAPYPLAHFVADCLYRRIPKRGQVDELTAYVASHLEIEGDRIEQPASREALRDLVAARIEHLNPSPAPARKARRAAR